jgi:hypothetical protein
MHARSPETAPSLLYMYDHSSGRPQRRSLFYRYKEQFPRPLRRILALVLHRHCNITWYENGRAAGSAWYVARGQQETGITHNRTEEWDGPGRAAGRKRCVELWRERVGASACRGGRRTRRTTGGSEGQTEKGGLDLVSLEEKKSWGVADGQKKNRTGMPLAGGISGGPSWGPYRSAVRSSQYKSIVFDPLNFKIYAQI